MRTGVVAVDTEAFTVEVGGMEVAAGMAAAATDGEGATMADTTAPPLSVTATPTITTILRTVMATRITVITPGTDPHLALGVTGGTDTAMVATATTGTAKSVS